MVDFKSGAEVAIGKYEAAGRCHSDADRISDAADCRGTAAADRCFASSHSAATGSCAIVDVGPFFDARTGPIVVIAAGPLSKSEARSLMSSISYDADVTWNENTYVTKKDNLANFSVQRDCSLRDCSWPGAGCRHRVWGLRLLVKRFFPIRCSTAGRPWNSSPCTSKRRSEASLGSGK
jgi:hypothetical protein